jgi:hypothetical protein
VFGGNQFNIENLNVRTSGDSSADRSADDDLFLFLKNSGHRQIDEKNLVESLRKLVDNYHGAEEKKISNTPMLIKLLKYEL